MQWNVTCTNGHGEPTRIECGIVMAQLLPVDVFKGVYRWRAWVGDEAISKRGFKTVEAAKAACEKYVRAMEKERERMLYAVREATDLVTALKVADATVER